MFQTIRFLSGIPKLRTKSHFSAHNKNYKLNFGQCEGFLKINGVLTLKFLTSTRWFRQSSKWTIHFKEQH